MMKKQKSRKPHKHKTQKNLPKRKLDFARKEKIYVAGHTGTGESRKKALHIPTMKSNVPVNSAVEARPRSKVEGRPHIEVHSGSKVMPISNVDIMQGSMMTAGLRVTNEIQGINQDFGKILSKIPYRNVTINDIEKVVIKEFSTSNWGITIYMLDEDGDDGIFYVGDESEPGFDSRESAINYVKLALGELIYEDALVNPENTLLKRTFLFGQTIVMLEEELAMDTIEDILQQDQFAKLNLDLADHIFQEMADKLGGVLTNERVRQLGQEDQHLLHFAAGFALKQGARKWPFD